MNHWTEKDIELNLGISEYNTVRDNLRTGDILFTSGNYFISKAIRYVTKSPWSHVGVILRLDYFDRVMLLESVESWGVRIVPLSEYLVDYNDGTPYDGNLVVGRIEHVMSQFDWTRAVRFGFDQVTKPYNKVQIAKILGRIFSGGPRMESANAFICSELVAACTAQGGYYFKANGFGYISPEDIWTDPKLKAIARLR